MHRNKRYIHSAISHDPLGGHIRRLRRDLFNRPSRMMILVAAAALIAMILTGCASNDKRENAATAPYFTGVSPTLILNRPNRFTVDPQVFAYRSPWPATEGAIELGQTTTYREIWHNFQSTNPHLHDYTYKRFRSYTHGATVR